jgi:ketosteroid isomerase-like protein
MTSNKACVQEWFDRIARGDAEGAFSLFSDDILYRLQGTTPVSGSYRGREQLVNDFFVPWRKQIDGEIVLAVDELIGEGDRVVALARGRAKTIHGSDYNNDYVFVFGLRDGKICEVIEYLDTALVETAAYGKKLVPA